MLRLQKSILQSCLRSFGKEGLLKCGSIPVAIQDRTFIGELIQRFRFKYMTTAQHHVEYDKWCKIFAVEGNIGVGKSELAKNFAESLDLKYYPSATHNYFIDRLNGKFEDEYLDYLRSPESVCQRADGLLSLDFFTKDPADWLHTAKYQFAMLKNRYIQYCDIMVHLLETGQGVTTVRNFYSDSVFAEAQLRMGWLRKDLYNHYDLMSVVANDYLLHPQVVLYLDMPAEQCYENVQAHGDELDKRLPLEFFRQIESAYKNIYLPYAREHGVNVIELDWTNPIPLDQLIENLDEAEDLNASNSRWLVKQNIQFERFIHLAKDLQDRFRKIEDIIIPVDEMLRSEVTDHTSNWEPHFCHNSNPKGLNPALGDKNIWLKDI